MVQFFIGLDHPANAWPFLRCMISANTLRNRKGPFRVNQWILDSGAFTELSTIDTRILFLAGNPIPQSRNRCFLG